MGWGVRGYGVMGGWSRSRYKIPHKVYNKQIEFPFNPSQSSTVDLNHWTHLLDIWMNRMIDFRKQKILQSLQFSSLSNKDIEERRSNY